MKSNTKVFTIDELYKMKADFEARMAASQKEIDDEKQEAIDLGILSLALTISLTRPVKRAMLRNIESCMQRKMILRSTLPPLNPSRIRPERQALVGILMTM